MRSLKAMNPMWRAWVIHDLTSLIQLSRVLDYVMEHYLKFCTLRRTRRALTNRDSIC